MNAEHYLSFDLRKAAVSLLFLVAMSAIGRPAAGDLDPTFGNGGIVVKHVMDIGHYRGPSAILLQPDGKILVSGEIDEYGDLVSFFIARFNQDGSPDVSFGYQGMVLAPYDFHSGTGAGIALQPDGMIVAVGAQIAEIAVRRFDSTGEPDTSFGAGGRVIFQPPGMGGAGGGAVALQPDGKIVVVGGGGAAGQALNLIVRLDPDGSFDESFGSGGVVTSSPGPIPFLIGVIVQPNGKLVTFGEVFSSNYAVKDVVIARHNADGSPDTSFGTNGAAILSYGTRVDCTGAAIQPDGKIIVSTSAYFGGHVPLVRYNTDGSIDTSFSVSSISLSDFSLWNFALQSDGKIVAFGRSPIPGYPNFAGISVVRLHSNGSIDTSFGTNGRTVTQVATSPYYGASHGVIQPDGKILALGTRGDYNLYEFALVRYIGDPPLSISGRVTTPDGRNLRNATVSITGDDGFVRTVTTNSFGMYRFEGLTTGRSYTIRVASKRYRFTARVVQVNAALTNVDFVGEE